MVDVQQPTRTLSDRTDKDEIESGGGGLRVLETLPMTLAVLLET